MNVIKLMEICLLVLVGYLLKSGIDYLNEYANPIVYIEQNAYNSDLVNSNSDLRLVIEKVESDLVCIRYQIEQVNKSPKFPCLERYGLDKEFEYLKNRLEK